MGKMKFLTVMIPAVAIVTALSLPAAAQSTGGPPPKGAPAKGPPPKGPAGVKAGVPAPHGPVTGAPGAGGRPIYAARPGAGHPGGHPGYRAALARHPGFARRDFGGHFYRGSLAWDRGHWRREWRNGRYGWWWDVGGAWYFYERPIYPYPTMISDVEVLADPALAYDEPPPEGALPPDAYVEPAPMVVAPPVVVAPPPAVIVAPPPVVCVGPLCIR